MPDLSPEGVHQFWYQYPDKSIYRVISFLEGVEHWLHDSKPEFEEAMRLLGAELDNLTGIDMTKLGHEDDFIKIGNCVSSARALRLLQAIDTAHPGSASRLLIYAEEHSQNPQDDAGLFLRRNVVFERLRLLSRVFSAERLAIVARALEGEDNV